MKLGELVSLYNQIIDAINQNWISILDNVSNGHAAKYPTDATYAIELTNGEIQLLENIKLYNKMENIAFYILDAKNKVKVPELGVSISYAEEYLNILNNKLFSHSKLLEMITDAGFEIQGVDSKGELNISLKNINKGFDVNAINDSIKYLENEINKYEDYLSRVMWSTEIAFENEDMEVVSVGFQSDIGTAKKKEEKVDLSEYVRPKEAIKKMDQPEEKFKVKGCPICNSNMRDIIEKKYIETEGNIMQTLDYATTKCGLFELSPNILINHLDFHNKVSPKYNQIEEGFNNPDLHTPMDHILETSHNTKTPINNLRYSKNNIKPNTNNPDGHIPYQHIEE